MAVSSYGDGTETSGVVRIIKYTNVSIYQEIIHVI